ncbi:hypothetical protein WKW80_17620 [Variovorax humicola]|uniref:Uncharacterized protein n=1 Tax=Variovorax humicola TaxID=1769758 RepID=A0ABU8W1B0_9BURK
MHLKSPKHIVPALVLAAVGVAAPAAEIELEGSRLIVSGMLDGSALPAFIGHASNARVRTVMFENSTGGSAEVAEAYAQVIRDRGLLTEARGQCQAACAYAFLAGKEHRFGRGGQVNALLIPLPRRPTPAELLAGGWRGDEARHTAAPATASAASGAAEAVTVSTASSSASADAPASDAGPASAPKEAWLPGKGMLFTSTPTFFGRVYNTYYCDGNQGTDLSRCDRVSDADPYKLGVLTQ